MKQILLMLAAIGGAGIMILLYCMLVAASRAEEQLTEIMHREEMKDEEE